MVILASTDLKKINFSKNLLKRIINLNALSRLGMSVTTQGGSGRQFVTGPGQNIFKYRFKLLNVYRFRET